jgi:hypothetical protein
MAGDLSPGDFLLSENRAILRAIQKIHERGEPADIVAVVAEVSGSVSADYVSALIDGVVPENFRAYVSRVRAAACERQVNALCELLVNAESPAERMDIIVKMQSLLQTTTGGTAETINSYDGIENAMTMKLDYVEPLIDGLLGRGTVNLLSGDPGIGKSYVALRLGIGVALGTEFAGQKCRQSKVLYLDRENPLALVQKRLSLMAGGDIPGLKIWGGWLKDPPALIGDSRLLQMARGEGPILFIVDSLVRFHAADENSASEMRTVMAHVRALADVGSTVLLLHHRPKSQEILYRGSSDILAGVDVAFSIERDGDGLKLAGYKDRDSQTRTFGLRVDFAKGQFLSTDTEAVLEHRDALESLRATIEAKPGIAQNKIAGDSGLRRADAIRLLRSKDGILWRSETGKYGGRVYYPKAALESGSQSGSHDNPENWFPELSSRDAGTGSAIDSHCPEPLCDSKVVPGFSTPRGWKPELVANQAGEKPNGKATKTMPSCPACGSFALYREPDGTTICQTCVGYV